jgi:hypothetical protein
VDKHNSAFGAQHTYCSSPCAANSSAVGMGKPDRCTAAGCISLSLTVSFHLVDSSMSTSEVRSIAVICNAPSTTAKGALFCPAGMCKIEWKLREEMLALACSIDTQQQHCLAPLFHGTSWVPATVTRIVHGSLGMCGVDS